MPRLYKDRVYYWDNEQIPVEVIRAAFDIAYQHQDNWPEDGWFSISDDYDLNLYSIAFDSKRVLAPRYKADLYKTKDVEIDYGTGSKRRAKMTDTDKHKHLFTITDTEALDSADDLHEKRSS